MSSDVSYGYSIVGLIVGIIFAWACAKIAGGKGYSAVLFAILGFFFSCITLVIVLVLPRRTSS
ncbi:MAG TPA: hypothetical protein VIC82_11955 [Candidatus Nanopelagicales bacterium]|jgi:multisubunit Na+/H+ antiporter MnhE subunit